METERKHNFKGTHNTSQKTALALLISVFLFTKLAKITQLQSISLARMLFREEVLHSLGIISGFSKIGQTLIEEDYVEIYTSNEIKNC